MSTVVAHVGGADPGADALGAISLVSMPLREGRGYTRRDVENFRRIAVNTVAHLEAEAEALRAQVGDLRRRLDTDLSPEGVARGLVYLLMELRKLFCGREVELAWVGQELTTILTAFSDDIAEEIGSVFPDRVSELANGSEAGFGPAEQLVEAVVYQGGGGGT